MRIIFATFIALFVCISGFFIFKFWGLSQPYIAYKHPLLDGAANTKYFKKIDSSDITKIPELIGQYENLYIDISSTVDGRLVIVKKDPVFKYHNKEYKQIQDRAVDITVFSDVLKNKIIILNMIENPVNGSKVFLETMKTLGFEKGENFIFTSPYDPPLKIMKEDMPIYLLGTSEPENLKLKAMESLNLIEAANIRSDFVIYPLDYYHRPFFTETLITEIKRRFRYFIIGPVHDENEKSEAEKLKPFGIILN